MVESLWSFVGRDQTKFPVRVPTGRNPATVIGAGRLMWYSVALQQRREKVPDDGVDF